MNSLLDAEDNETPADERELTLSTGAILGIFFGLVLLCGLVFGLGYKLGTHKPVPIGVGGSVDPSGPATNFGAFKPAAGSPAGSNAPAPRPVAVSASTSELRPATPPVVRADPPAAPVPAAAPSPGAEFVVQIAAVSHEEDAGLLVNALRAKGYPVSATTSPQDKFFHIQVGPFTNRKDAEAAKQRLVGDGYQPIVK